MEHFLFIIFSENMDNLNDDDVISNRCYLELLLKTTNYILLFTEILWVSLLMFFKKVSTDIVKTSLFQNHTYTIQKYFDDFNKNELFFTNPTSKL